MCLFLYLGITESFDNNTFYIILNKNLPSSEVFSLISAPALVHNATVSSQAVWHIWNVICNGIPLSSFTQRARQVFSSDMKASGDARQSWSPMMMAWGKETASIPVTWELFWVSALLWWFWQPKQPFWHWGGQSPLPFYQLFMLQFSRSFSLTTLNFVILLSVYLCVSDHLQKVPFSVGMPTV